MPLEGGILENSAYVRGHFGALIELGHLRVGVLLQVELASLPGHSRENGHASSFEAGVIDTDEEFHAA